MGKIQINRTLAKNFNVYMYITTPEGSEHKTQWYFYKHYEYEFNIYLLFNILFVAFSLELHDLKIEISFMKIFFFQNFYIFYY